MLYIVIVLLHGAVRPGAPLGEAGGQPLAAGRGLVDIYIYIYKNIYIYIYIYIYKGYVIHVCVYIYIYIYMIHVYQEHIYIYIYICIQVGGASPDVRRGAGRRAPAVRPELRRTLTAALARPVSLPRLSLLRFVDSTISGNPLWA